MDIIKQVRDAEGVVIIDLAGELTLRESPAFHGCLLEMCEKPSVHLIINMRELTFIDSSGVGTFTDVFRRIKKNNGKLALVGLNKMVRSVFEITRLDRFFSIYETEQEALKA